MLPFLTEAVQLMTIVATQGGMTLVADTDIGEGLEIQRSALQRARAALSPTLEATP
jgi:hypothetical protein